VAEFDAIDATEGELLRPDYNVAPTDRVHVVRRSRRAADAAAEAGAVRSANLQPGRVVTVVRWGLVPSWAEGPSVGSRMLNARAETLIEKPAFRAAFARRRCLIPADGWFEWTPRENAPGKQPYFMTPAGGGRLAFAGLWEVWGSGDELLYTCTVVTTEAVGALCAVHDRMPLVLPPDRWAWWLGEHGEADVGPVELLAPPAEELVEALEIRPVGAAVGNVRSEGPELVARVAAPEIGAGAGRTGLTGVDAVERIDLEVNPTLF